MDHASFTPQTPSSNQQTWAFVPLALLASMFVGLGSMAAIAVSDPHFAVEKDYYQKAVGWDRTQAQAARDRALAYEISMPEFVTLDARGRACVRVELKDATGHAIRGAKLSADAFANAYSAEVLSPVFTETSPGVFTASVPTRRAGLWEFRFVVDNGSEHFTSILRRDFAPGICE